MARVVLLGAVVAAGAAGARCELLFFPDESTFGFSRSLFRQLDTRTLLGTRETAVLKKKKKCETKLGGGELGRSSRVQLEQLL